MVESGRLGNQLFQYLALRSVAKSNERIVLFGFDQLKSTFDGLDAHFVHIETNPLKHLVSIDYSRVQRMSAGLPGLGIIREDDKARPARNPASSLAIALPSWFQSDTFLGSLALQSLQVKPHLLESTHRFLTSHGLNGASTAFVQVRAGDYRLWPTPEKPAILPPSWYRDRIAELRLHRPELTIVAIGDEPSYTQEVITGLPDSLIFNSDYAAEFALMTVCSGGVLSASSFAYWGAYFAKRNYPQGAYLAPRFWAGHATGSWWPDHIQASFIDYR